MGFCLVLMDFFIVPFTLVVSLGRYNYINAGSDTSFCQRTSKHLSIQQTLLRFLAIVRC